MRSVGHVVRVGRMEIHNVFGRESEGKRPFGKHIRRKGDNITRQAMYV
jgi:hypothetical protein